MLPSEKEKIPLFKRWSHWYWFLILLLVAEILFFNWITRYFS